MSAHPQTTGHGSIVWEHYSDLFLKYSQSTRAPLVDLSDKEELALLELQAQKHTTSLERNPRSLDLWLSRSDTYMRLHFPELAASDAWKALIIIKSLGPSSSHSKRSLAVVLLCRALFYACTFHECLLQIEACRKKSDSGQAQVTPKTILRLLRLRSYALQGHQMELGAAKKQHSSAKETEDRLAYGEIRARVYSWLKPQHLSRGPETRLEMRRALYGLSLGRCAMGESGVRQQEGTDCQGIFATKTIPAGTLPFHEIPKLVAASDYEGRCNCCCKMLGLPGPKCEDCWLNLKIPSSMKWNLEWRSTRLWRSSANDSSGFIQTHLLDHLPCNNREAVLATERLRILVFQNLIRQYHESNSLHPLDSDPIRQLTGFDTTPRTIRFSFLPDIKWPIEILQTLGIDVFVDLSFDACVLFTIFQRLDVNSWEETSHDGIHFQGLCPFYSLFNHSCDPNIKWNKDKKDNGLTISTLRSIKAGEELKISYLGKEELQLSYGERNERLVTWMPADHTCERCDREARVEKLRIQWKEDGDSETEQQRRESASKEKKRSLGKLKSKSTIKESPAKRRKASSYVSIALSDEEEDWDKIDDVLEVEDSPSEWEE